MLFQTKTYADDKPWIIASREPIDVDNEPEKMIAMVGTGDHGEMIAMNFWGTIKLHLNPQTTDLATAATLVELMSITADRFLA